MNRARTEQILQQGQALVCALKALETINSTGPIETAIVWFLLKAYQSRLRAIVGTAPTWMSEEILSASQRIPEDRPAVWLSEN